MGIKVGTKSNISYLCALANIKVDKLENNTDNFKFFEIFIGVSKNKLAVS